MLAGILAWNADATTLTNAAAGQRLARPFWCYLSARVSGLTGLEKRRRLFVMVTGDEIVVTSDTGFRAAYCRRPHHPQLIVRRRTDTDDHEVIAQAWQAANDKARELGWIGTLTFPSKDGDRDASVRLRSVAPSQIVAFRSSSAAWCSVRRHAQAIG
jgi:hypothetical protein